MKQAFKLKWKYLFFGLVIINVLAIVVIIGLIFWPVKSVPYDVAEPLSEDESSEFVVRTTKKNLNELVNAYIDKFLSHMSNKLIVLLINYVFFHSEIFF